MKMCVRSIPVNTPVCDLNQASLVEMALESSGGEQNITEN